MFKHWLLTPYYETPGAGGGGGAASDNVAASVSEGAEPTVSGVSSGTASDAMIKAAMAASSAEEATTGAEAATSHGPAKTGDTTTQASPIKPAIGAAGTEGQAPENRITAAVRNARADEREVVTKELAQKFGWAANVQEADARVAFGVAHELATDSQGFLQRLAGHLGYTLTKGAAQTKTPAVEEMPKPTYRSEDGQMFYSAEQHNQALDIHGRKLAAQIRAELQPLQDAHQSQRAAAEEQARTEQNRALIAETMTELRAYPHFQMDDGKGGKIDNPAIMKELLAIPANIRQRNPIAAIYRAYNSFFAKGVFPTIATSAEDTVRAANAKKAAAARGNGHPVSGSTGAGQDTEIKGVDGLAAHMERLAASNDPRFGANS